MRKYGSNLILNLGNRIVTYDLGVLSKVGFNYSIISTVGDNVLGLKGKIKIPKNIDVMIRVKHLWKSSFAVEFQSRFFLDKMPGCIVFDTSDDPGQYEDEVKKIAESTPDYAIDLGTDGDLDRVYKFEEIYESSPRYIFVPINPLKYRNDIIDYCREKNIDIIATEIYGNRESEEWMKETFTTDYLERFALLNSFGIELDTSTLFITDFIDSLQSIRNYIGKEEVDDKLFSMASDVWIDKVEPAKRRIMSYGLFDGSIFYWPSSKNSGVSKLSFKDESKITEAHKEKLRILDEFIFPETFSKEDKKRYSDMIGISTVAIENPRYKMKYSIQEDITLITMTNKYLPWRKKFYLCSYTSESPYIMEFGNEKT